MKMGMLIGTTHISPSVITGGGGGGGGGYSKTWTTSADFAEGNLADKFYAFNDQLGIGWYSDFEGINDIADMQWSDLSGIWDKEGISTGVIALVDVNVSVAVALTAGFQGNFIGADPDYSNGQELTAKPQRPIFIAENKTWIVDYDDTLNSYYVYGYDAVNGIWTKAHSGAAIAADPDFRFDTFYDGVNLFVAGAHQTQNMLWKLSLSGGQWSVDASENVNGAMLGVTKDADANNAPNLVIQGDSVGRLWLFWHQYDPDVPGPGVTQENGSNWCEARLKTTLALATDGSMDVGDWPFNINNTMGDDIISTVTFNDGVSRVGFGFTRHASSAPVQGTAKIGFMQRADSNDLDTWSAEEDIDTVLNSYDDHLSIVADNDGNLYVTYKTSLDATGPLIKFAKRNTSGTWLFTGNQPWGATLIGTRPCIGIDENTDEIFICITNGGNIEYRKSNKDTISWGAAVVVIDGAATMNDAQCPKDPGNATTGLLVVCTGSTNYRNFGLLTGSAPTGTNKRHISVKSPSTGADYAQTSCKFLLPPGVTSIDKYTLTMFGAFGQSYQTPFVTPNNASSSTNRARPFTYAYTDNTNAVCGCFATITGYFRIRMLQGNTSGVYPTTGQITTGMPIDCEAVVNGDLLQNHVITIGVTDYDTDSDAVDMIGANNTFALCATWFPTGGHQHEGLADAIWLRGGLGSGEYVSSWADAGSVVSFFNATINAVLTGDQSGSIIVQVSNNAADIVDSVNGGAISNGETIVDISDLDNAQYVRFKITLDCGTTSSTPTVLDVTIATI